MKTVAILSQKGGTGKTTLALHMAVAAEQAGETPIVIDLDPQASATAWKDAREAETPDVLAVPPGRFQKALDAAKAAGVTLAIIDTAPHSHDVSFSAAKAADLVLIACGYGFLDVTAIGTTAQVVESAGAKGFVVFNRMPPRATSILADVTQAVEGYKLKAAPVAFYQRAAYTNALTAGLTAQEYEPGGKAAQEVDALYAWLRKTLKT